MNQINKIRNGKVEITTDIAEMKRIMRLMNNNITIKWITGKRRRRRTTTTNPKLIEGKKS